MKVFIAMNHDTVCGVFSTRKKAEKVVENHYYGHIIEEVVR